MFTVPAPLPDDPAVLRLLLTEALAEIARLTLRIAGLERHRFGRKSEQLGDDAIQRQSEELEQSLAEQSAQLEAVAKILEQQVPDPSPRPAPKRNRGALPAHLPRIEVIVDVEDRSCPCCGKPLHVIGDDRAEMLRTLANLTPQPESVPVNALVAVPGTPLADMPRVDRWSSCA